jgi:PadR family transcriptional regulator, regulatory protein PadR
LWLAGSGDLLACGLCGTVSVTDTSMSKPSELVQGTLDALILQTLSLESLHGLAVAQRLRARSGDVLSVSRGSLYPALHKLEQQGLLRAEWRLAESGKRAKYYSLTHAGVRHLAKEQKDWERLSAAISMILKPT